MAISKTLLLLTLVALGYCQQLNGHINPLWLSTGRREEPASSSTLQQSGHVNSLWLSTRGGNRSPLLQLYFLDSAGTFRPLTLQNQSPIQPLYRGTERDYEAGRTGSYDQLPTPYRSTNY
nr:uncharacterized protein LOC106685546 isoform X2 [Halyomorpha halys]